MLTKAQGTKLTKTQVEQYRELGYVVVPDVFDAGLLAEIRRTVDAIVADAAKVTTHTDIYDLEECEMENGPLLVVPGTHKGPVHDHHANGYFVGAMDPAIEGLDYTKAVPLTGRAGSMTIHHARLVHGSALNTSAKPRRLLLHEYAAADAWPLMGVAEFAEFNGRLVLGKSTIEPRLAPVPVRSAL